MNRFRFGTTATAGLLLTSVVAVAQEQPATPSAQARELFESGAYQQVVEAAGPEAEPSVVFTAVLSQQKLGADEEAAALSRRLIELPEESPWHFIGLSTSELLADNSDAALASATRAAEMANDGPAEAHYQLGLVLARRQAWREAAAAFDRAWMLNPEYAYAHYYGGLSHYRANRPDLMAVRFERFLKLAPNAPERPEVLQIMRTIRGR